MQSAIESRQATHRAGKVGRTRTPHNLDLARQPGVNTRVDELRLPSAAADAHLWRASLISTPCKIRAMSPQLGVPLVATAASMWHHWEDVQTKQSPTCKPSSHLRHLHFLNCRTVYQHVNALGKRKRGDVVHANACSGQDACVTT